MYIKAKDLNDELVERFKQIRYVEILSTPTTIGLMIHVKVKWWRFLSKKLKEAIVRFLRQEWRINDYIVVD